KRHVFGLGLGQVAVTTILVSAVTIYLFGLDIIPAILVGGAVAMSSTALCLKVLASVNALGLCRKIFTVSASCHDHSVSLREVKRNDDHFQRVSFSQKCHPFCGILLCSLSRFLS